jgi:hypothetical protein
LTRVIVRRDVAVTFPSVRRAASAPSSDRSAIVEPARFALLARSFKRPSSPLDFEEPRRRDVLRRGVVRRDAVFLPEAADFPCVPVVRRRARVVFLRRAPAGLVPVGEEEAP